MRNSKLSIGDIVHSELTREEGRIVRVVQIGGRLRFVVATLDKKSGKEVEMLWHPRELTGFRKRVRKYLTASGNSDDRQPPDSAPTKP